MNGQIMGRDVDGNLISVGDQVVVVSGRARCLGQTLTIRPRSYLLRGKASKLEHAIAMSLCGPDLVVFEDGEFTAAFCTRLVRRGGDGEEEADECVRDGDVVAWARGTVEEAMKMWREVGL